MYKKLIRLLTKKKLGGGWCEKRKKNESKDKDK